MTARRVLMFLGLPAWLAVVGLRALRAPHPLHYWQRAAAQYDAMWQEGSL